MYASFTSAFGSLIIIAAFSAASKWVLVEQPRTDLNIPKNTKLWGLIFDKVRNQIQLFLPPVPFIRA